MNRKIISKVLASMILISMLFANISAFGEVFANNENLENQTTSTNNASVDFDAYFKDEDGNKTHTITSNLDNEVILYLYGKVEEGYLKDINISINNANFKVAVDKVIYGDIENATENSITINRIRRDEELEVKVPLKSIKDESISLDMFSKQSDILMNATLVRNNSKTKSVNKTINVALNWNNTAKVNVSQEVIKYVPFQNEETKGIILQTKIKTALENNTLPVEKEKIIAQIPTINEKAPTKILVLANNTFASNGKNGLEFNTTNWNIDNNIITINVDNKEENGKIIWKKDCQDEFILTFIYNGIEDTENEKINLVATSYIKPYTLEEKSEKSEIIFEPTEKLGDYLIASVQYDSLINKGYMYTGFETEYKELLNIDIANEKLVNNIKIKSEDSKLISEKNEIKEEFNANAIYKTTKINKTNFENILGEDGFIKIYNEDKLIATIDKTLEVDELGNYVVSYEKANKLSFETSGVKEIGTLLIENTKVLPKSEYSKEDIESFKRMETVFSVESSINKKYVYKVALEEPTTQIQTEISNSKLSTLVENENIDIMVTLKNSKVQCKLFENPIIVIKLPESIEKLSLNDETKILFTDELKVKRTTYNEEAKEITIETSGIQTKYNDIFVTEGTIVTLNANILLKENTKDLQDKIYVSVKNGEDIANSEILVKYITPNKEEDLEEKNEKEIVNQELQANEQINEIVNNKQIIESNINENEIILNENNINENLTLLTTPVKETAELQLLISNDIGKGVDVKEGQILNYKVTAINNGKVDLNSITIEANIPEGTTFREFVKGSNYSYDEYVEEPEKLSFSKVIDTLKPGKQVTFEYQVIVNEKKENTNLVSAFAIARIDGYQDVISETIENKIVDGMFNIDLITKYNMDERYINGDEITYIAYVQNIKSKDLSNVKIECKIPEEIEFKDAYFAVKLDGDGKQVQYDEASRTVIWNINKLDALSRVEVDLVGKVNTSSDEIKNTMKASSSGANETISNEVTRYVDKSNLTVSQYANIADTTINVGDILEYYITIKNNGTKTAENVNIVDTLPSGLENVKLQYKLGNEISDVINCKNKEITLSGFEIEPNTTLNITITAKVSELPNGTKGTVEYTNKVNVNSKEIGSIDANDITHKLKVVEQRKNDNTIEISGQAWIDSSRDGKRDDNEQILKGIEVRLLTKDEKLVATVKTDKKGQYVFKNVAKGEYLVAFIYDTSKYTLTTYQAKDVVNAINSDVAMEKEDFVDGNITKFGITDVILVSDSSIYNIDLGLQEKTVFDLSLSKTISKVTVKNSKETKSYTYNNKTLAKVEIASKNVNDTTIIIEYTFKVTNEGNVAGYAKNIVDYLPKDLKFSTELNKDWYIGKNGNINTNSLENVLINPGETKEVKLVVTKAMNDKNLGTINNSAEIQESYNNYGIQDIDSTPGNNSSKEDDFASADMLISLNTGTVIMYTGLAIGVLAVIILAVYMIKKKILIEI